MPYYWVVSLRPIFLHQPHNPTHRPSDPFPWPRNIPSGEELTFLYSAPDTRQADVVPCPSGPSLWSRLAHPRGFPQPCPLLPIDLLGYVWSTSPKPVGPARSPVSLRLLDPVAGVKKRPGAAAEPPPAPASSPTPPTASCDPYFPTVNAENRFPEPGRCVGAVSPPLSRAGR